MSKANSTGVIAVEGSATDVIYNKATTAPAKALLEALLHKISPQKTVHGGDNLMISYEIWAKALLAVANDNGLLSTEYNEADWHNRTAVEAARTAILGTPAKLQPGGALANSFAALVQTKARGIPAIGGTFITAHGDDLEGQHFAQSLNGFIEPKIHGHQTQIQVIPLENGERIVIATPHPLEEPILAMDTTQLTGKITSQTKLVMLGGYMAYNPQYTPFAEKMLHDIAATSPNPAKRPTMVLTAASAKIVGNEGGEIRSAFEHAIKTAPTVFFANMEELHGLVGTDTSWRAPFDAQYETMNTAARDAAEANDAAFKAAQQEANTRALNEAFARYSAIATAPFELVVTNGKHGVHVITNNGIQGPIPVNSPPKIVNTVGAGDNFAAGYLMGHLKDMSLEQKVQLGSATAGVVLGQPEARLPATTKTVYVDGKRTAVSGIFASLDLGNPHATPLLSHALGNGALLRTA